MRAACLTREPSTAEQVEACAAAAGGEVTVVDDLADAARWWRQADLLLVGADVAGDVAAAGLPQRADVHLVGPEPATLVGWSAPLHASVLVLPDQSALLSALLSSTGRDSGGRAQVLRLVGGSGGLGVSTVCAGLALAAARRRWKVAVVELATCGGGLDLVFGAEQSAGWRWPELAAASGHVGDLGGRLPTSAGVDLVSAGRGDWQRAPAPAVRAVLGSLVRTHDLVVVDAGRGEDPAGTELARCQTWLMVGADVRSVVAAQGLVALAGLQEPGLVVRQGRGRGLPAGEVSRALELPARGRVRDDRTVPLAAEAGDPPGRSARSVLGRDCAALLDNLDVRPVTPAVDESAAPGPRRLAS
ncbi:septum site-determining protein Ssd [Aestuariimicrobium ganziense]|uniref:septum site-determining protein Ssd n=1 Tax=Aestuariimicrobium ganziense TaxID=2773677 RepID=UPI001945B8DD|nr:septum site-determining protein Ssd [Aestuariimicrobium ganziense]